MGIGSHGKRMVREDLIGKIGTGSGNYKLLNIQFSGSIFYTLLMPIPNGKNKDYNITSDDVVNWILSLPISQSVPLTPTYNSNTATKFPISIIHSTYDVIVVYYEFSGGSFTTNQEHTLEFTITSQINF